jgi:hypothetical protein
MHYEKDYKLSRSVWTKFDPKEDVARQEFRADCDIQTLLARHGAFQPLRPAVYGEVDFDVSYSDLAQAEIRVAQAAADAGVSTEAFLDGFLPSNQPSDASEVPSEGSDGSPSDSAAVGQA